MNNQEMDRILRQTLEDHRLSRGAARHNRDNFVVTGEPGLVKVFSETFEELWEKFA
jgi:hypothetical protein